MALQDFKSLADITTLKIDLRYASPNNVLGYDLYQGFNGLILHNIAHAKLKEACRYLHKTYPNLYLLLLDATRPPKVQKLLWDYVEGTDMEDYVANPAKGSVHSFGFAVDITLANHNQVELDMGTEFDSFQKLAQPRFEQEYLQSGKLSQEQYHNRCLLREVMQKGGFIPFDLEWWHFDALPPNEVRKNYRAIE